jgi:fused signal recognition particle receptor
LINGAIASRKTRDVTFGKIATFFGATEIEEDTWDNLEELLIQADIGVRTTLYLIDTCQEKVDELGLTRLNN